jgi:aminoglycoside phosphotransferase (APT) family kinase protein
MSELLPHAALDAYMRQHFGAALGAIEPIGGGQSNPTFFITVGTQRLVLRKQPHGPILKGAHAVDREYRVLQALSKTDVPVPTPRLYCVDPEVLGTPFYVMERIEGRVFHDAALPELSRDERGALYRSMAETLAKLHALDPNGIGLSDFGRAGNYFERQLARWSKQWKESSVQSIPALDQLIEALARALPSDDDIISIVHGDYRMGNLMVHPTEPRVIGILDWELSTLGHPLADLGFAAMAWHTTPKDYGGIAGLDFINLGIPTKDAFVSAYMNHAKDKSPLMPFHIAFALFRFAVIFVGIAERARLGNAAGKNAADIAPLAQRFAEIGLSIMENG